MWSHKPLPRAPQAQILALLSTVIFTFLFPPVKLSFQLGWDIIFPEHDYRFHVLLKHKFWYLFFSVTEILFLIKEKSSENRFVVWCAKNGYELYEHAINLACKHVIENFSLWLYSLSRKKKDYGMFNCCKEQQWIHWILHVSFHYVLASIIKNA